jgi:hypothetical protein
MIVIFFKFIISVRIGHCDYLCQAPNCLATPLNLRYCPCWCITHFTGIHIPAHTNIPLSVHSACIIYSEVISFGKNCKQWQPQKLFWCGVSW